MNSYPDPNDPTQMAQYPPNQGQQPYGAYQGPSNVPSGYGEQPPYQQSGYQQAPYQQSAYQQPPYQMPPYQQAPYAQARSTIALDWRYLTAGIGAFVAFVAFFLPSYSGLIAFGGDFNSLLTGATYLISGAQYGRWLWLEAIIALIPLGIAILLQFGNQMFKTSTSPNIQKVVNSLNTQPRTWGLALLLVGAFGIFFHFILGLSIINLWAFGAWLYFLGIIAVTVGGFFVWRPLTPTSTQAPPTH